MKKLIVIVIVLVAVGAGAGAYYIRKGGPEPQVSTAQISRGDIVDTVGATGTLEAVTTVQVGTQVSGSVQELYADFNSIVHKGQVIARLDPSLIQTQIEQQRANVVRSEADLERLRVTLADTQQKLKRAQDLAARNLIPKTELETADVNVRSADAQLKSSQASLTQARAALHNQEVNLAHTVIEAPIDGIVISRNVDVGQTVAASMQAPTLFVLAADLTKMQVNANIDEADVGRMRPGQVVRFRVDAYPTDEFIGSVQQVRLEPKTVQNVVTYQTVISVPNPQLKLKPGMTANVNIEIARRTNVLRVPNAALRFRPTTEIFAALNQPVPPEMQRGQGGRTGSGRRADGQFGPGGQGAGGQQAGAPQATTPTPERGAQATTPAPNAPAATAPSRGAAGQQAGSPAPARPGASANAAQRQGGERGSFGGGRGGFDPNMTPEERRKRFEERMAQMTPEERAAFEERMRERQAQGGGFGGRGAPGGNREGGQGEGGTFNRGGGDRQPSAPRTGNASTAVRPGRAASAPSITSGGATTIDSLFGPLPVVESFGRAWLYINKQLKPVRLRLGITDGTYTEVLDGAELQPGTEVVTNIVTGLEQRNTTGQQGGAQNPLMGPQRGRGGPGGFGGPGGGGRGGR
jgi:HlyD family secretion protein